jgi:large subunit ribosomal protein L15
MAPTKKSTKQADPAPQPGFGLADLKPARGAKRAKLRVGRGRASGAGKTANRGHNGEGQRSGQSQKRGFEGGQMPLYRRLPHIRGFEVVNRKKWYVLNVKDLAEYLLPDEEELTYKKLQELGFYNPNVYEGVRILGNGEINRKVVVEAHHVSPSAQKKIEAAGGKVRLLGKQQD